MKRFSLIALILSMLAVMVGTAGAQDRPDRAQVRGGIIREVLEAVSDETGLPVSDILVQLQPDGVTLADVIEANGGSVETVVAATVERATNRVNQAVAEDKITQEHADVLLANLEQRITDGINGDLPFMDHANPRRNAARALITAVTDATGMDARSILQEIGDGKTLPQVIEDGGSTVDAVVSSAMAMATEQVNRWVANEQITQAQADALLISLEQAFTDIVNGEFDFGMLRDGRFERPGRRPLIGVVRQVIEETGLSPQDLMVQLRDGATPAEILTENGVELEGFVDGLMVTVGERLARAVESGRLTQVQADERLDTIRTTLTDRLNNPVNVPPIMPPETESSG